MSAKLAEKLAEIAELYTQLGTAHEELSALYDAASAKSGKSGDDGDSGKVSGRGGKAAVGSKKTGGKTPPVDDDVDDELPAPKAAAKTRGNKKKVTEAQVREAAMKVLKKHGKDKVTEILGGKLAEVDEDDYAEKLKELEEALEEEGEEEVEEDV